MALSPNSIPPTPHPDTLVIFDPHWSPPTYPRLFATLNKGVCVGTDPELFFGDADTKPAQKICQQCPVQIECLRFAVLNGEKRGVWGGTSGRERRRMYAGRYPRWVWCEICQKPLWATSANQVTCGGHS